MNLARGTRMGPYEVLGLVGVGGMGEVYRARDPRLGRDIAIKVLPASFAEDPDRLRRFERESRAAGALNHPNLVSVFDVGRDGQDAPFLVMELLDGSSLATVLADTPLTWRRAADYAAQIARGLGAAHDKGILHRDLKPANLFVTREARVKILDFGLAKNSAQASPESVNRETTATEPGKTLGTVGYMSPEQVRGLPADQRSDLFSLGAVLFEMLSRRRAFQRATSVETLNAILNDDPPDLFQTDQGAPPTLERIVRRCLEKDPALRFQSAHDLAFALETLSDSGVTPKVAAALRKPSRLPVAFAASAAMVALVLASAAYFSGTKWRFEPQLSYQQLTFRRGTVWNARFAPDGQNVVYSAAWEQSPLRLYVTRVGSTPQSGAIEPSSAQILAISSKGEMALLLNPREGGYPGRTSGTLARVGLAGGTPREVMENVVGADWSPDGTALAVVRSVQDKCFFRLEYPVGKVLFEDDFILWPRISPRGDLVAFRSDDDVCVVDRTGKKRTLTAGDAESIAWSPAGNEIWYDARTAEGHDLVAVDLSGKKRRLARWPTSADVRILDVARDGSVLLSLGQMWTGAVGAAASVDARDVDLSGFDSGLTRVQQVSMDGRWALLTASPMGTYLARLDGSSDPVRLDSDSLGKLTVGLAISPDHKWVLTTNYQGSAFCLLPTGAGSPRQLTLDIESPQAQYAWGADWSLDGRRILLFGARKQGRPFRAWVYDVAVGATRPVTPEGVAGASAISPDGRFVAMGDAGGHVRLYPVDGGEVRTVPGPLETGAIQRFSRDSRSLFSVENRPRQAHVFRRDLGTGRRELVRSIALSDVAGVNSLNCRVDADGRSYACSLNRNLSSVWAVSGLR